MGRDEIWKPIVSMFVCQIIITLIIVPLTI